MPKNKPWDTSKKLGKSKSRHLRRVLIACEDSKSSRYYFESFPIDKKRFEVRVLGTGMNTVSLVRETIRQIEEQAQKRTPYSATWCVFDRDSFPKENFNEAFRLAGENKISVAWANEAFELWYLLHFNYHDSALARKDYADKLLKSGLAYDKADKDIFSKVQGLTAIAVRNAKRLEKFWNDKGITNPEKHNPSTSVHKLVEYLLELAELGCAE